jgi:hypothetical protein
VQTWGNDKGKGLGKEKGKRYRSYLYLSICREKGGRDVKTWGRITVKDLQVKEGVNVSIYCYRCSTAI